jgi:hypothetical protein
MIHEINGRTLNGRINGRIHGKILDTTHEQNLEIPETLETHDKIPASIPASTVVPQPTQTPAQQTNTPPQTAAS